MAWYDLLPCDRQILSEAVSHPRYVLKQVMRNADREGVQYRECRDCGTTLDTQSYCPRCGSTEIGEYDELCRIEDVRRHH